MQVTADGCKTSLAAVFQIPDMKRSPRARQHSNCDCSISTAHEVSTRCQQHERRSEVCWRTSVCRPGGAFQDTC
jgi:hypothetical protein